MNDLLLARVASAYRLHDQRLLERASAQVAHVATSEGELAVKHFAPANAHFAHVETALLAHLHPGDARYRVQTLVRTAAGAPFLEGEFGAVLVTRWVRGTLKRYTEITSEEWHALGATLAALHLRLETCRHALPRMSELSAARDLGVERAEIARVRALAHAKNADAAREIDRYLDVQLGLLDARGVRASAPPPVAELPIHNDYNQYNYIFDGVLPPTIIDWEGAIAAAREYEVVRCLNHLPLVAVDHARAFVDGYRAVRPLDRDGLRWAIDAALTDHALKRWPLEQWLAGERDDEVLRGSMEVLHALAAGASKLEAFFLGDVA